MPTIDHFFYSQPMKGVYPSGDGWFTAEDDCRYRFTAIDSIGHGLEAYAVTLRLIERMKWIVQRSTRMPELPELISELHHDLCDVKNINTQAAITVVDLDKTSNTIQSVAIGNVSCSLITQNKTTAINSCSGMVGGRIPASININKICVEDDFMIVFTTDGLSHGEVMTYLQERIDMNNLDPKIEVTKIVSQFSGLYDDSSCGIVRVFSHAC